MFIVCCCLYYYSRIVLIANAEVAADGERLGLLLDLGLLFDLGRTLRLAFDPLRTRRSRACCFAHRAPAFQLAVWARAARCLVVSQFTMWARGALHALLFPLSVGAGVARRAVVSHLPVRAGGAVWAVALDLPVRAGLAHRALVFHPAVGTRVALLALVFLPSMRAQITFSHYSPPRALASAFSAPRRAKTRVVALSDFSFVPFRESGQIGSRPGISPVLARRPRGLSAQSGPLGRVQR